MKSHWSLSHDTVNKRGNTRPGGERQGKKRGCWSCKNTGRKKKSFHNVGNYGQTELTDKIKAGAKKQIESVLSLDVG